jgi:hypothetical protein
MNMRLSNVDLELLFYGIFMFVSLLAMAWKVTSVRWLDVTIDIAVFALVF